VGLYNGKTGTNSWIRPICKRGKGNPGGATTEFLINRKEWAVFWSNAAHTARHRVSELLGKEPADSKKRWLAKKPKPVFERKTKERDRNQRKGKFTGKPPDLSQEAVIKEGKKNGE